MKRFNTLLAVLLVASTAVFGMDEVVSISLIDPDTDTEIRVLNDGDTIDVNTDGFSIALRANTGPSGAGSVQLVLTGAEFENRIDNTVPYTVHGDGSGDIFAWSPSLGSYTLTATPYEFGGGTGDAGTALSIDFVIINDVTSGDPPPVADGAYIESGGLVIMEAETEDATSSTNWYYRQDVSGFTNEGYYEWKFGDPSLSITGAGSGIITYEVDITTTGRYRFVIRSAAPDNNDHNDVWARFPDNGAVKVQGASEGSLGTGWFKVYQNVSGNTWTYQTKTVDFDAHQIYSDFDTPGTYRIQLSGRSTLFKVDRLTLYHSSVSSAVGEDPTIPESPRVGDPPPMGCEIPTNPNSSVSSPTSASLFWDFATGAEQYQVQGREVGGSAGRLNVSGTSTFLSIFVPGATYEYRVRAICDGGSVASDYSTIHTFTMPTMREEAVTESLKAFPNPATTFVTIQHTDLASALSIYNITGQVVKTVQLNGNVTTLDIADLAEGSYVARVNDKEGSLLEMVHIIKQ